MNPSQRTANHNLMRAINRTLILNHLRRHAPQSRAELAEHIGLTRSTVSSLVEELAAEKLVHETGIGPSRGGRPGTRLELNPAGGCAVGVEITGDSALVMLTDFVARPLWEQDFSFNDPDAETVIPRVEALIDAALDYNTQHDAMKPLGIGLGISGLVNAANGTLTASATLGWRDIAFRERWEQRFGLPVHVGNEASIAALGEQYFGAGQRASDFIYLGITPTAIGAGVVLNGALYQGTSGYAGEVGHMLIDPSGPPCRCGKYGCWEAMLRYAINGQDPATLGRDPRITAIISIGIANLVNIFNPQLIVLGGPVGRGLGEGLTSIRAQVAGQITILPDSTARIELTQITSNACALGAVAQVLDAVMGDPARYTPV